MLICSCWASVCRSEVAAVAGGGGEGAREFVSAHGLCVSVSEDCVGNGVFSLGPGVSIADARVLHVHLIDRLPAHINAIGRHNQSRGLFDHAGLGGAKIVALAVWAIADRVRVEKIRDGNVRHRAADWVVRVDPIAHSEDFVVSLVRNGRGLLHVAVAAASGKDHGPIGPSARLADVGAGLAFHHAISLECVRAVENAVGRLLSAADHRACRDRGCTPNLPSPGPGQRRWHCSSSPAAVARCMRERHTPCSRSNTSPTPVRWRGDSPGT